jgi:hypothetical protein
MLFFQLLLFAGYLCPPALRLANALTQCPVHAHFSLAVALLSYQQPSGLTDHSGRELKPATTGSPVLASFAPRSCRWSAVLRPLRHWASAASVVRASHSKPSHRLYSVSNLGSFLALFAFPAAFERVSLRTQGYIWSVVSCCLQFPVPRAPLGCWHEAPEQFELLGLGITRPGIAATAPRIADYVLWFGLSACASSYSGHHQPALQDVAVVPLLWVLPLGVYLLSFVLAEHSPGTRAIGSRHVGSSAVRRLFCSITAP